MSAYCVTPTGELVIYPSAHYAVRNNDGLTELWTNAKKESWVADIPNTWACGWTRPQFSAPRADDYAALKRALRNFDSRTGRFKD